MPELPEVEVVRRSLEKRLKPQMILKNVIVHDAKLRFVVPTKFLNALKGEKLRGLDRVGKFLIFEFENDHGFFSHLGMTGKWLWDVPNEKPVAKDRHLHLSLTFGNVETGSEIICHYHDVRKFGFLESFGRTSEKEAKRMRYGKDPLRDAWSDLDFLKMLKSSAAPIKTVLLNQQKIFGIGNIYAAEILFRANVRPQRSANKITKSEAGRILTATKEILSDAIEKGGSSIRDFVQGQGISGSYQHSHLVYGRGNLPCAVCGQLIRQKSTGGRMTYWCTRCQR